MGTPRKSAKPKGQIVYIDEKYEDVIPEECHISKERDFVHIHGHDRDGHHVWIQIAVQPEGTRKVA